MYRKIDIVWIKELWVGKIPWRKQWQPTPVFLPGESHGRRSLVGYSPRGCKESDMTERLHFKNFVRYIYCKYFLSFYSWPFFFFFNSVFQRAKVFKHEVQFIQFFSYGSCFLNPKKYLSTPRLPKFFVFVLRSFIVLVPMFRSVIHFKSVDHMKIRVNVLFFYKNIQLSGYFFHH